MHIARRAALATVLLTLVLAVGACSSASSTPVPQASAEAAACAAIQTLSDELNAYAALDPSTVSMDEVIAQQDRVKAAAQGVRLALDDVDTADTAATIAAAEELEAAIDDFDSTVPVADAIAAIKTAAEPLKAVYREMADGLGCVIATPY